MLKRPSLAEKWLRCATGADIGVERLRGARCELPTEDHNFRTIFYDANIYTALNPRAPGNTNSVQRLLLGS